MSRRDLQREWLLPCECHLVDTLLQHGTLKELPNITGLAYETIKNRLYNTRRKTACATTLELARNWPCELFQIGLHELGIRR